MSLARRLALPLALRIFLLAAVLVLAVAGTAVVVALSQGQRIADRELERALATSVAVQREFEQRRLEQLQFMVQQLAADASFVGYVADAQTLALGQDDGAGSGSLSVRDLLIERRDSHGFDLAMVLDAGAGLLARSDSSEQFAQSLADDPLVGAAHDELRPFSGYWRQDGNLYQAAIVPLQQDQDLVGFLLLALRVDDGFASRIAGVSGAQIAFLLERDGAGAVVASSLPGPLQASLPAALAAASPARVEAGPGAPRLQLTLAGQTWIAQRTATADAAAPALGQVVTLVSTQASAAGYRRILDRVLLAGLAALLLGLALSLLLAAGVLRPVRRLADATESAAAGNYRADVALPGRDQLARLSRAVDGLLASLREKSDIEGYLGQLTRALPDAGEDAPAAAPVPPAPRREVQVLLAVQLPALAGTDADAGAAALAQVQAIAAAVAGRDVGGAAIAGDHLLLACAGEAGIDAALRALARLHAAAHAAGRAAPAAALHRGDTGSAGVALGSGSLPLLYGPGPALATRLLAQAPAGTIALTPAAADLCRLRLGAQATALARTASGAPLMVLRPEALAGLAARATPAASSPAATAAGDGPAPGAVLAGRYQVVSLLGTGGMGAVYKVRDLELGEIVALKLLRPGLVVDAVQLERLKDELRLARRITHPNVLRTYDFVEIDGAPCISMEYVRGTTLRWLLDASGTVPLSAGLRIARQLAAGLAAAHAVGVLHRDIKPENVILEATGTARLMDFGIARPIRRTGPGQTQVGSFVGTPAYCAPEQLAGEALDARTDLYALGVLMCEMFGGRLPHAGTSTVELYLAKSQQPPTPPSAHGAGLPPALEALVMACLQPRPQDRPATAQAVLDALARIRA
jgi:serine/threonine-protein kinase